MSKVEQTVATRNQSTAVITSTRPIFIFDNRFVEGIFKNGNASADLQGGQLIVRDTTIPNGFKAADDANLADVIGISAYEGKSTLAANETVSLNIGTKGGIDGNLLVFPDSVTLDTVVGNITLRDYLEQLGFHIDTSTREHTKLEN
jgi:hypothetical protein